MSTTIKIEDVIKPRKPSTRQSLSETHPELTPYWDYDKNCGWGPQDFCPGSVVAVWWICAARKEKRPQKKKHSFQQPIRDRVQSQKMQTKSLGCIYCGGWKRRPKDTKIEDVIDPKPVAKGQSLQDQYPELTAYWKYSKNCGWKPADFTPGSSVMAWWRCAVNKKHSFQAPIRHRVLAVNQKSKTQGCTYCRGLTPHKTNSLANFPTIAKEWLTEKNSRTADQVVTGSQYSAWWQCSKCHKEWEDKIVHRTRNKAGCPFCAKKVKAKKSLPRLYPQIAKEWHPQLNGKLKASDVTYGSNKEIWWQCRKNPKHVWSDQPYERTVLNRQCPYCFGRKRFNPDKEMSKIE